MTDTNIPVVALAGAPNAGKSVLFNALTGLNQKVANYAGVTVEKKSGLSPPWNGRRFMFSDLPGIYSLDPVSLDEKVAIDVLMGQGLAAGDKSPDLIVATLDASNLERTLGLALELKDIGIPMIIVLNMMDLAQRRGLKINTNIIARELACQVIPMIATHGDGIAALMAKIDQMAPKNRASNEKETQKQKPVWLRPTPQTIKARFNQVDEILAKAVESASKSDQLSWKIDKILLHPLWGSLVLTTILLALFHSVFTWATPLADTLDSMITLMKDLVKISLPPGMTRDLISDGILSGVGSVVVFLPQILMLFLFINLLEGSGYMARAAFMLDRAMYKVGLQGRSFVPLLSSFACAIPGIMATRTIRDERDRITTILVAPLITCSARLPVYTLLVSAFVSADTAWFGIKTQAWVMFGLFLAGVASAFIAASVSQLLGRRKQQTAFMLELPSYRWPHWRYVGMALWHRALAFIQRAGTVILGLSVCLWFLSNYPKPPANPTEPAIHYSAAATIGRALEPLVRPIGFDWRIATGLVPGLAAREVMVSSLATVFAVEMTDDESGSEKSLKDKLRQTWPPATAFALIAWYIFAPQCISTLAAVRRETGGWRWPLILLGYTLSLAWIAAFVTFRLFS
ncbi:MAG: ferrous iron transporter B [bacterium]